MIENVEAILGVEHLASAQAYEIQHPARAFADQGARTFFANSSGCNNSGLHNQSHARSHCGPNFNNAGQLSATNQSISCASVGCVAKVKALVLT
jgi:hypothetical protein